MNQSPFTSLPSATPDLSLSNVEKLKTLFPHLITEGADGLAVDWDLMKQEFSKILVEGEKERYRLEWPGKREALFTANRPTTSTLRPDRESSKNFDATQNLYIEGDNLEALKLLRQSYLGKVKMIYIDPPYNTGHDFVYNDEFAKKRADELTKSGTLDALGLWTISQDVFKENTEANGRYHSDWLSMMYPRLKLARDLLSADGVIFISIDDNEAHNLRKLCDEIFGEQNFVAQLVWQRAFAPKNDARFVSNSHDYIVMYARDLNDFTIGRLPRTKEANERYSNPDNDPRGVWMSDNLTVKTYSAACDYPITTPSGRVIEPPAGRCWRLAKNVFLARLQDNRIWFGPKGDGVPRIKRFLSELKFDGMAPTSLLFYKEVGHSQEGAQEVSKLMEGGFFDGPKPVRLLKLLMTLANLKADSLVLDFFSGSASTAHALMEQNAGQGKSCRFILVQLPETASDKGKAAGFETICEIGKERIRRAGAQIQATCEAEGKAVPDVGFRVLKVDSSNLVEAKKKPEETAQTELDMAISTIKEGRTEEDLLFQAIRETGELPLTCAIERQEVDGVTVWSVDGGTLVACFAKEGITAGVAAKMAEGMPAMAVFRESGFANDTVKANVAQQFVQRGCAASLRII